MMTSSNGNIFRVTGPLCGEFTGPGEFPAQRPVTRSFDVFFHLRPNKLLSKQPRGWWFETPPWSLWRHCNGLSGAIDIASRRIPYQSFILSNTKYWPVAWLFMCKLIMHKIRSSRKCTGICFENFTSPYEVLLHKAGVTAKICESWNIYGIMLIYWIIETVIIICFMLCILYI